jgi:replication factor C subunit 3/5
MSNNMPWIEKYRPSNFKDIISHDEIINTFDKLISSKKFPHTIFFGPPGTGKTSTIIACAKEIYGNNYKTMVLELNGSDDRGIKVVREQIKDFSEYNQLFYRGVKLVILDEADSMTYDAQFALRRVIENYTHNTRFCLICNYITKLIPALQSRCITFRFGNINDSDCKEKLSEILNNEGVKYNDKGINSILQISNGDMRKSINLLQCVVMATKEINEKNVYKCAGEPTPKIFDTMLNYLTSNNFKETYDYINEIRINYGLSLIDLIKRIDKFIFNLKLDDIQLCELITDLSKIENNLSNEGTDEIQLASMIACFFKLRYIKQN